MHLLRLLPAAVGLGLFLSTVPTGAQTAPGVTYRGRVVSANGQALAGATVLVRGTQVATSTNADGLFLLTLPKGPHTFVAEYPTHRKAELFVQRPDSLLVITLYSTQPQSVRRR